MDPIKFPWRLEVRASIFHPWRNAQVFPTLESAMSMYRRYKSNVARIRAN